MMNESHLYQDGTTTQHHLHHFYQPQHHHHQLPFLPSSSTVNCPLMGEPINHSSALTTTTTTNPQQQPSPPPSSSSLSQPPTAEAYQDQSNPPPVDNESGPVSAGTASATKIPFRPRKMRRISTTASSSSPESNNNDNNNNPHEEDMRRVVMVGKALRCIPPPPRPLSLDGEVAAALCHLRASDPQLSQVMDVHNPPTLQHLYPPFHSLARSILYQQLAYKAATSIYTRFLSLVGGESGVVPETVLALNLHQLRQIGVSGRKASYLHDLANKYKNGILSDEAIIAMDDRSLLSMLTMVKGIGTWSVHMFMIFSLHRPDVLPVGDLGVRKGVQILYGLDYLPRPSQMEQLCERWRPYRSVGAWYMWRLVESKGSPPPLPSSGPPLLLQQHPQEEEEHQQQSHLLDATSIEGIPNLRR